jgi:GDP-L-fucose synthase
MNRVLVTGAGGVVGRALVNYLTKLGNDVVAIVGRSDCNLEDAAETNEAFKHYAPSNVFHLAGAVYGLGGNLAYPGDAFRRNILMNTNVVEACRQVSVRKIVGMGSAAMYSDGLQQPLVEADAMSGMPHASELAYASAKRALLVQLISYRQQFGLDFAFAIATNMYGPGDRFEPTHGHVVPSLLRKFDDAQQTGQTVEVWGDGTPTRDFLYSNDAAIALELMMEKGEGVYNVATGQSHSIADLVSAISSHYGGVEFVWNKSKPMGQLRRNYDVSRLRSLGFAPTYSLEAGIAETVEWLKSKPVDMRV